jgi:hypothetical protein
MVKMQFYNKHFVKKKNKIFRKPQTHGGSKLGDYVRGEDDILEKRLLEEYKQIKILEIKVLPQKWVLSFLWFYVNKI